MSRVSCLGVSCAVSCVVSGVSYRSVLAEEELSVIRHGTPQPAALAAYQVVEVEHRPKRPWLPERGI